MNRPPTPKAPRALLARTLLVSSLVVAPCALVASAPAFAQDKKELDVTTLVKQGIAAATEGKWEEAKDYFETAWQKSNAYDVAANLALVEEHFGNYARAAELFAFALQTFPPGETEDKRTKLQQKLDEMRPKVATLAIDVDAPACAVTINDKPAGTTPLTTEVYRAPGKQRLRFEKKGYLPQTKEVDVAAGQKETIVIRLVPEPKPIPQTKPLPMWPAGVGFGLAGAGALLGGGMMIAGAVRSGDATDFAEQCAARNRFPGCRAEGQSIVDDVDLYRTIGIVGFITAGAALAFSIPYTAAAVSSRKHADDDVAIVPVVVPGFQGAVVRSRF